MKLVAVMEFVPIFFFPLPSWMPFGEPYQLGFSVAEDYRNQAQILPDEVGIAYNSTSLLSIRMIDAE